MAASRVMGVLMAEGRILRRYGGHVDCKRWPDGLQRHCPRLRELRAYPARRRARAGHERRVHPLLLDLSFLVWSVKWGKGRRLRARTRIYQFIDAIGPWAMLDVFLLAILVSLV